ncbi:AP2 domain-containing protein [Planctomycetota bacterium]
MLLYRRLRHGYAFRKIPLTKGQYAIVDPDDYYRLSEYKWFSSGGCYNRFYAVSRKPDRNGKRTKVFCMHREVANTPDHLVCDHINGRTLDNRKANLRSATRSQNNWNSRKTSKAGYSKYKGITYRKRSKKWAAMICVNGRSIFLGLFKDEIEAAKAYDKAAKKYCGEFAKLNFPAIRYT